MPTNEAAYLTAAKATPLEVKTAPYTKPGKGEIVIRNHAVAMNPLDYIKQGLGDFLYSWIKYPAILGSDVAGEIVEVGEDVTRFKIGDRVVGHSIGMAKAHNYPSHCGFQMYTVLLTRMTSHIPDGLGYDQAAVMPLGLSTAACGLFQKDHLALPGPAVPTAESTGQTLLIWGASTSVGSNAVQLAVAAGFEVIATASPHNFDYVRSLGAAEVFDYNSKTVVQDIQRAFKDRVTAGAMSIGHGSADPCLEILSKCTGRRFLSMVSYPMPATLPKNFVVLQVAVPFVGSMIMLRTKSWRHGISTKFVFGDTLVDNEVGPMMYERFLPQALAGGSFVAVPEAMVVGHGLEQIQHAVDVLKEGVSAKKVVVTL